MGFQQRAELHETEAGDLMFRDAAAVLTDHPYTVQSKPVKASLEQDVFIHGPIRDLVELFSEVMPQQAHEYLIWAWLKFGGWYQT